MLEMRVFDRSLSRQRENWRPGGLFSVAHVKTSFRPFPLFCTSMPIDAILEHRARSTHRAMTSAQAIVHLGRRTRTVHAKYCSIVSRQILFFGAHPRARSFYTLHELHTHITMDARYKDRTYIRQGHFPQPTCTLRRHTMRGSCEVITTRKIFAI